jgi:hypothetical protein
VSGDGLDASKGSVELTKRDFEHSPAIADLWLVLSARTFHGQVIVIADQSHAR